MSAFPVSYLPPCAFQSYLLCLLLQQRRGNLWTSRCCSASTFSTLNPWPCWLGLIGVGSPTSRRPQIPPPLPCVTIFCLSLIIWIQFTPSPKCFWPYLWSSVSLPVSSHCVTFQKPIFRWPCKDLNPSLERPTSWNVAIRESGRPHNDIWSIVRQNQSKIMKHWPYRLSDYVANQIWVCDNISSLTRGRTVFLALSMNGWIFLPHFAGPHTQQLLELELTFCVCVGGG